jgi:hypothetical protein
MFSSSHRLTVLRRALGCVNGGSIGNHWAAAEWDFHRLDRDDNGRQMTVYLSEFTALFYGVG